MASRGMVDQFRFRKPLRLQVLQQERGVLGCQGLLFPGQLDELVPGFEEDEDTVRFICRRSQDPYEKAYAYFNLGIRHQMSKDRLTLSMVAHDIFHTARYYNSRTAPGLMSRTTVRPKYPNVVLSLTWNFNSSSQKGSSSSGTALFEGKDF